MTETRQTVSSGYSFEDTYGYARAVRVGDQVFVSGTTAATALEAAGAELRHVVRTVIYIVDMADAHQVATTDTSNDEEYLRRIPIAAC